MIYQVSHSTQYKYSEPVSVSHQMLHLTPRTGKRQNCANHQLTIVPEPAITSRRSDYFGNQEEFCIVQEPHKQLDDQSHQ